jgi:hypothetical protein
MASEDCADLCPEDRLTVQRRWWFLEHVHEVHVDGLLHDDASVPSWSGVVCVFRT